MRFLAFGMLVMAQTTSKLILWDTSSTQGRWHISFQVSAIPYTGYFIIVSSPIESSVWQEEARMLADAYAPKKLYRIEVPLKKNFYYRLLYRSSREETVYLTLCPRCEQAVPSNPKIWVKKDTTGILLSCLFPQPGQWVLRAFDRYGQEVFTYPLHIESPGNHFYELPHLRGRYLLQVQELKSQKIIEELSLQL